MLIPSDLFYSEAHIWVKQVDNGLLVGITDFAQESMGAVGYVELPSVGERLEKGNCFGSTETAKVASDLFAPLDAVVAEINEKLDDNPEMINLSPYEDGWLILVTGYNADDLESLMNAQAYKELVE